MAARLLLVRLSELKADIISRAHLGIVASCLISRLHAEDMSIFYNDGADRWQNNRTLAFALTGDYNLRQGRKINPLSGQLWVWRLMMLWVINISQRKALLEDICAADRCGICAPYPIDGTVQFYVGKVTIISVLQSAFVLGRTA